MVEKIKTIKDTFLEFMEQDIRQRGGVQRVDIKLHGELADIVKDLAQAEKECWETDYYRTVIDAMDGNKQQQMSGYGGNGRMGYDMGSPANGGRMGYGTGRNVMGYSDPVSAIRDMLATSTPETRAQIRNELSNLISM